MIDDWFFFETLLVILSTHVVVVQSFLSPLKACIKTSISNAAFGGMLTNVKNWEAFEESFNSLFSNQGFKQWFWSPIRAFQVVFCGDLKTKVLYWPLENKGAPWSLVFCPSFSRFNRMFGHNSNFVVMSMISSNWPAEVGFFCPNLTTTLILTATSQFSRYKGPFIEVVKWAKQ